MSKKSKDFLDKILEPIIENTNIRFNQGRKNSGKGKTQVFGYGNVRGKGYTFYANNKKYPELYNALVKFGNMICPKYIPFTSIQVNHNYKSKKHIDKNNYGYSLAFSFGDFERGELVIDGKKYQTNNKPTVFNGALREHYNEPIIGNRYSLIYFISAKKDSTEEQIREIHKNLLDG